MSAEHEAGPLESRFGTSRRPERRVVHPRPSAATDDLVSAMGKLGEALELVEHARGHLYAFHRLSGSADRVLREAVSALSAAGRARLADDIDRTLVGRDVIAGRWTFELVEDYDATYVSAFREAERHARETLGFEPHVFEAEMKHREQTR